MARQFTNQTVLITGASEGIGAETARQFANLGASVLLVARNKARLDQVAASLPGAGRHETFACDLTDRAALDDLLAMLDGRHFTPDIVVNNAGSGASGAFVEDAPEKIDAMVRLNVDAVGRITHWAAQRMAQRGSGRIVNVSTAVATRPTPYFAAYAATKAFVTSLSQAIDAELKPHGVRVSAIHPPAVKTSFAERGKADLRSTLVLKLFPAVSPTTVAKAIVRAARTGKRSIIVGPIAAIIMGTAPIMPRWLDLAFMGAMFRHRGKPEAV